MFFSEHAACAPPYIPAALVTVPLAARSAAAAAACTDGARRAFVVSCIEDGILPFVLGLVLFGIFV